MRYVIVGTAGHIDHGKTRLVQALTGVDCDRLGEEKARGITIDIGFAPLSLPGDLHVGFVDVPGHERFVKNMLAGATGIDMVILVVAADESVKPQTREHFDVCRLLGVGSGIVALTKADLADREMRELVSLEIADLVKGSFLEGAPVISTSAVTGEGLDELRAAIAERARAARPRPPDSFFRLPVDRSFSIKGFGTVVTGTIVSGSVRESEELAIYPAGHRARVRGIQVHGLAVPESGPGRRTALNLQGVSTDLVQRGSLLAPPGCLRPSPLLDVKLRLLEGVRPPLKDLARVRYHQGTAEILARVKLLGCAALEPGSAGFAQLRLERPAVSLPGDRFVIRRYSPMMTIGGGVVLDAHPLKHRGRDAAETAHLESLGEGDALSVARETLRRLPGGADAAELVVRTGLAPGVVGDLVAKLCAAGRAVSLGGGQGVIMDAGHHARMREAFVSTLDDYHRSNPLSLGMPREELLQKLAPGEASAVGRLILEGLAADGKVRLERDLAAAAGHAVALGPAEERIREALEEQYRAADLNPPTLDEAVAARSLDAAAARRIYHLLLSRGRLVRIKDGKVFHTGAIERLKARLWELRKRRPVIDVAGFKELTGTSRKNAIPLLEHMDAERVTRRRQNDREILPPPGAETH